MRRINQFILVACACLSLASCTPFPPPHISKPQVKVNYVGPKISPDERIAYFIKVVSQFSTKMYPVSGGFRLITIPDWEEQPYLVWSRAFFCRSDNGGNNPVVIAELPQDKFRWENNNLFSGPVALAVSWKQQKAVTVVNRLKDNISFIDLNTGKCVSYTISDPMPRSPTAGAFDRFEWVYVEPIENDSTILWSIGSGVIGTVDFEGNTKVMDLRDRFEPVTGFSPESERRMAEIEKNSHHFSWPVWNEEQGVFAIKVTIGAEFRGTARHEVWVFNSKLESVEKFSFEELGPVLSAERMNKTPPEHKYAWVVDKLLSTDRFSGHYKPTDLKDAAAYYNSYTGTEPNPEEFQLKNHAIEHKRIDPKDAAAIW